jgi:hypothetical protein
VRINYLRKPGKNRLKKSSSLIHHLSYFLPQPSSSAMAHKFKSSSYIAPVGGQGQGNADDIDIYLFQHVENRGGAMKLAMTIIHAASKADTWTTDWNVDAMVTYIGTVSCLIFKDMSKDLEKSTRVKIHYTQSPIDLRDYDDDFWVPQQPGELDADFAARANNPAKRNLDPVDSGFMGMLSPTDVNLDGLSSEITGGRWGIEMFPIAKNVSLASIEAYVVARPKAVAGALHLREDQKRFLNGDDFRACFKTLDAVKAAFDLRPGFRYAFGDYWVRGARTSEAGPKLGFNVTFQFTESAGFGGAILVCELLATYPVIREFPPLSAAAREFDFAMKIYEAEDEARRGFFKVLYGSEYKIFRNLRGPLLGVAVLYARQSAPSAVNFMDTAPFEPMCRVLNDFLRKHGLLPIALGSTATPQGTGGVPIQLGASA